MGTRSAPFLLHFGDGLCRPVELRFPRTYFIWALAPDQPLRGRKKRTNLGRLAMNKLLIGAIGAVAMGLSAPASAADMAARPYTKAPAPAIATIYDWSGFYIGINGGGGSSRNCWSFLDATGAVTGVPGALASEGCHNATGGTVGGQI